MGDSDDEYDRKRRDKFRGERSAGGADYRTERRDDRRPLIGGGGGVGGGRDEWVDRNPFRGGGGANGSGPPNRQRPDYREYRGPQRDRYGSPGREMPPAKRMRPDFGDDLRNVIPRYGGYDPYMMHAWSDHYATHGLHGSYGHPGMGGVPGGMRGGHGDRDPVAANSDMQTQPPMYTLKQFLDTQDDGISDAEVLRKYNEYKLEFKRQQLNEFFVAHKDEEWFKIKYHPIESIKRKEEQLSFLKRRMEVFNELLENGQIKSVTVDASQQDPLLRLLDTVVIKLEGGTDEDLKILDEKPKDPPPLMQTFGDRALERKSTINREADDDVIITSVEKRKSDDEEHSQVKVVSPQTRRIQASDDEENWDDIDAPTKPAEEAAVESKTPKEVKEKKSKEKRAEKRKRTHSDSSLSSSSDSDSNSSSSSDDDDEDADEKLKQKYDVEGIKEEVKDPEEASTEPVTPSLEQNGISTAAAVALDPTSDSETKAKEANEENKDADSVAESGENIEKISESTENLVKVEPSEDGAAVDESLTTNESKAEKVEDNQPETIDLDKVKDGPQARALHRTSSIFLRNLAPSITKAEIKGVCKNYDGFLRVAIADPNVERRWYRRGWVTFKRDVNIKEICWNLNNTRLRDCEMGAIVNRDLSRRVRPVSGLTSHKTVVRSDIKLCAKIAMNLDEKFKLWMEEQEAAGKAVEAGAESANGGSDAVATAKTPVTSTFGFKSNNPVLQNIADYLIEEASAEEEELLGLAQEKKENDGENIERDPQLISVLDSLILYLRIVHSVDFYNHCEYPYEDEMPNRCGIIHARGPQPSRITQNDIMEYIKNFESKMQQFLAKPRKIDEDELKNLGTKDCDAEVEKFIQANSQELAKDKWLCPLSGKKFKGPEFIRKHIFNKHAEKVDEVKREVEYFNNYLKDPKRPQLPEHPGTTKRGNSESGGPMGGGYRPPVYPPPYAAAPPYAAYAPPMLMPGRGGRGYGGGPRRPVSAAPVNYAQQLRQYIHYRDLDAPQD